MKVEHITALTQHSVLRDTADILLPTRHHFAGALPQGKNPVLIPGTSLSVMLTVAWPAAVFTIYKGETPLLLNVCCYASESREQALALARDTIERGAFAQHIKSLRPPVGDQFIITIPVLPFADPQDFLLAGEVELYIYHAIYEQHS